jgi:3-methylcrotonyl-CoA carboxylase alpha subunit
MPTTLTLRDGDREYRAAILDDGSVQIGSGEPIAVCAVSGALSRIGDSPPRPVWSVASADMRWVFFDGAAYRFEVVRPGARPRRGHHGTLTAPMPATVRRIQVAAGDTVGHGDVLVILEAMKMELPVRAPAGGVVTAVNCREGDLVSPGVALIEIDENTGS